MNKTPYKVLSVTNDVDQLQTELNAAADEGYQLTPAGLTVTNIQHEDGYSLLYTAALQIKEPAAVKQTKKRTPPKKDQTEQQNQPPQETE